MDPIISIKNVCAFGDGGRVFFEDASLDLFGGEKVLITAPIASGKSILLRFMAGLALPDKGAVSLFGKDVATLGYQGLGRLRTRMGFVIQDSILISNLKVIENVALPLMYHSDRSYDECMKRAEELLGMTLFRGDPWSLPASLPLYARKEVAVARALALDPEVVICENIWDGLTDTEKRHTSGMLLRYHEGSPGRLLVFTATNDADAALVAPGRIVRIDGNRLVEQDLG